MSSKSKRLTEKDEPHYRTPLTVANSAAWRVLHFSSKALWGDMRATLTSFNNGDISAALTQLKHRGWSSPATLAKALRQLEAMGFISATRRTIGVEKGSKVCNLYRFTDKECFEQPKKNIVAEKATRDWLRFTSVADAQKAVDLASAPTPRDNDHPRASKKTSLQKLYRHDAETVAIERVDATDSVVRGGAPSTKTVASTAPPTARLLNPANDLAPVLQNAG